MKECFCMTLFNTMLFFLNLLNNNYASQQVAPRNHDGMAAFTEKNQWSSFAQLARQRFDSEMSDHTYQDVVQSLLAVTNGLHERDGELNRIINHSPANMPYNQNSNNGMVTITQKEYQALIKLARQLKRKNRMHKRAKHRSDQTESTDSRPKRHFGRK